MPAAVVIAFMPAVAISADARIFARNARALPQYSTARDQGTGWRRCPCTQLLNAPFCARAGLAAKFFVGPLEDIFQQNYLAGVEAKMARRGRR
jgi:hypothetical protein